MSIGGHDIVLHAPAEEAVGDVILRTCRALWPNCVFEGAEEDDVRPLTDPWVWQKGTSLPEFFVFKDQQAAARWEQEGGTAANQTTMFYFLIGAASTPTGNLREVTFVCGRWNKESRALAENLKQSFMFLTSSTKPVEAA